MQIAVHALSPSGPINACGFSRNAHDLQVAFNYLVQNDMAVCMQVHPSENSSSEILSYFNLNPRREVLCALNECKKPCEVKGPT